MPLELRGTQATGGLRSSDRVQRTLMIHARRSAFPGECAKRPQCNRTAPKSRSPSRLRAIRRRARYEPLLCDALHSFLSDPSGTRGHNARRHEAATRWKEASCRKDLEVGIARLQRLIVERALDISILSESDEYSGTPQDLRSSSGAKSGGRPESFNATLRMAWLIASTSAFLETAKHPSASSRCGHALHRFPTDIGTGLTMRNPSAVARCPGGYQATEAHRASMAGWSKDPPRAWLQPGSAG